MWISKFINKMVSTTDFISLQSIFGQVRRDFGLFFGPLSRSGLKYPAFIGKLEFPMTSLIFAQILIINMRIQL